MKSFSSFTIVRQPVDKVWETMKDRLGEIGTRMEDLESVETLERKETESGCVLTNRWTAKQKVPLLLRSTLKSEVIAWIDHADWQESTKICHWRIEPLILDGRINCQGSTTYTESMGGRGTRVIFTGQFSIETAFMTRLPIALHPHVSSMIESVATTLVPRNLARAIIVAGELIEQSAPWR
jgi:hypothetical protein